MFPSAEEPLINIWKWETDNLWLVIVFKSYCLVVLQLKLKKQLVAVDFFLNLDSRVTPLVNSAQIIFIFEKFSTNALFSFMARVHLRTCTFLVSPE